MDGGGGGTKRSDKDLFLAAAGFGGAGFFAVAFGSALDGGAEASAAAGFSVVVLLSFVGDTGLSAGAFGLPTCTDCELDVRKLFVSAGAACAAAQTRNPASKAAAARSRADDLFLFNMKVIITSSNHASLR